MSLDRKLQVISRLERVLDPCSCLTEQPMNIVELGLVEEVAIEGTVVRVELVPTTPLCLYMAQIIDEAETEICTLDWVTAVHIAQNVEILWRPDRITTARDDSSRETVQSTRARPSKSH